MQHEMKAQRITPACVVACAGGRIQPYIHNAHARKKELLLSCMHPLFPLAGLNSQAEQRRDLSHSKHARSAIAISRATQARFSHVVRVFVNQSCIDTAFVPVCCSDPTRLIIQGLVEPGLQPAALEMMMHTAFMVEGT